MVSVIHTLNMAKYSKKTKDTAFWMAGCRAELVELSKDIYAEYWLNDASRAKHKEYTTKVSPTENIALSLRNRFFLEEITTYLTQNPKAAFINIGSGFSSYPFLMPENNTYLEIDHPDNIKKKKEKIRELQKDYLLPKRNIKFYPANLEESFQVESLIPTLKEHTKGEKSFLLYEGLIYYLSKQSSERLFNLAAELQTPKSRLGIVSWNPGSFDYPVYKRFKEFMKQKGKEIPKFIRHDPNSIANLTGYGLIQQTDYVKLSNRFKMTKPLTSKDDVFWETLTILEKN